MRPLFEFFQVFQNSLELVFLLFWHLIDPLILKTHVLVVVEVTVAKFQFLHIEFIKQTNLFQSKGLRVFLEIETSY